MSVASTALERFTSIAALREAAPRIAGTEVEFTGGVTANAQGRFIGDIVAMAGGQGPILGDKLELFGPLQGVETLFGQGGGKYSGYGGVVSGVIENIGGQQMFTNAKVIARES